MDLSKITELLEEHKKILKDAETKDVFFCHNATHQVFRVVFDELKKLEDRFFEVEKEIETLKERVKPKEVRGIIE